jgi:hypothetical protein
MINLLKKYWKTLLIILLVIFISLVLLIKGGELVEWVILSFMSLFGISASAINEKKENKLKEEKKKNEKIISNSNYSDYYDDGRIKPRKK